MPNDRTSSTRGLSGSTSAKSARVEFVPIETIAYRLLNAETPQCFASNNAARRFLRKKWRSAIGNPSEGSHSSVLLR